MPDYSNWNTVEVTYSLLCFILCSLPFPLACSVLPKRKTRELLERSGQKTKTVRTAGSCDRRGARTTPRLCPASPLAALFSAESRLQSVSFCVCRFSNAPARRRNARLLGSRRVRARLCPENRTQPRHAAHAGGQAFFCCACWNASNRFRMRSCSHSVSSFASFCS